MGLDSQTLPSFLEPVRRRRRRLLLRKDETAWNDDVSADLNAQTADFGLFGISILSELGGMDLTSDQEALMRLELGRASPEGRSIVASQIDIGSQGILIVGTDRQRTRFLR